MKKALAGLIILIAVVLLALVVEVRHAGAQAAASVVEIDTAQGPWATTCQTHTGVTTYCFATDALAISVLGAPYTKFQGAVGATGPIGPVGPQGPAGTSTAGVSSLNGHTGALTVSLGASPISITP